MARLTRAQAAEQIAAMRVKIAQARSVLDTHIAECAVCVSDDQVYGMGAYRRAVWHSERGDLITYAKLAARRVRD